MRLFFDATVLEIPFTGIAKTSLMLYRECLAQRPETTITGLHRKPLAGITPQGVMTERCGRFFSSGHWRSSVLPRLMTRRGATAVHFPWNGGVPEGLRGCTIATTIHDVLPLEIPGSFKTDQDELRYRHDKQQDIERSHILFTDSEYSKRQLMAQFALRSEPIVNYFGPTLDCSDAAPGAETTAERPYLLYLGGYDRRKGIVELLRVFLELYRHQKLACRLLLAGKAHYFSDELKSLIAEGTHTGAVQELGYVPDPELPRLLRNALALVYPSRFEGFGLPPLEAMSAGCPVVTTACTSIPEVCGAAALYIDPCDSRGFGEALVAVQDDEPLRRSLRQKGLHQAAGFSWQNTAATFLSEIERYGTRKGMP
ncbi:glycosyltransferase family 4 protein [Geobacter sp. FeAm09]|uniref:glycosyltransferase family 4 protein n=1 Tax=Geobacter sp. FeAm09 TaxID=2597769 RepID=UPI0011EE7274|nr:glycosyltransferase family 1 protein [Geobacter sp. FeAm09]QEM67235.1 glycosyltransferase family 4 protein [Geobacter sp. FeAm09]